jgi:hypothetical protein
VDQVAAQNHVLDMRGKEIEGNPRVPTHFCDSVYVFDYKPILKHKLAWTTTHLREDQTQKSFQVKNNLVNFFRPIQNNSR